MVRSVRRGPKLFNAFSESEGWGALLILSDNDGEGDMMGVRILQSDSGGDSGMLGGGTMIGDGSMGVMRGKGDAMIGVGAGKESGVDGGSGCYDPLIFPIICRLLLDCLIPLSFLSPLTP